MAIREPGCFQTLSVPYSKMCILFSETVHMCAYPHTQYTHVHTEYTHTSTHVYTHITKTRVFLNRVYSPMITCI